MLLQNFPMDTQVCPMLFESCKYACTSQYNLRIFGLHKRGGLGTEVPRGVQGRDIPQKLTRFIADNQLIETVDLLTVIQFLLERNGPTFSWYIGQEFSTVVLV